MTILLNRVYTNLVTREFIHTKEFDERWKSLSLTDDDLSELQSYLCTNPNVGDVMQGTGGIRKVRWALPGKGKSGGVRVVYLDIVVAEKIYLLSLFAKNEKANLSKEERNDLKNLVALIKQEAKYGK